MLLQQTIKALTDWLELRHRLADCHRQLLIISGTDLYCKAVVNKLLERQKAKSILVLGQSPLSLHNAMPMGAYRQILGSEYELAIIDANDTLRPNAILAVAGTITQSGLMVICCPDFSAWPGYSEINTGHYLSYNEKLQHSVLRESLTQQFMADPAVATLRENKTPELPLLRSDQSEQCNVSLFKTIGQKKIFEKIIALTPVENSLITADRGRGKSTLLGMIAGQRLSEKALPVIITSRYADSIQQVFEGLRLTCPQARRVDRHTMSVDDLTCRWLPLDHPGLQKLNNTLLIIDEAASIPVPQLTILCETAPHVLLSTTLRGYEGSGRGFITRFLPWLNQHRPDITHYHLTSPIRWFENDPVERFWYQAFCLDTTALSGGTNIPECAPERQSIRYIPLNRSDYFGCYNKQLLPLLMQAHYQTTADELVRLYDSPNNHCLLACTDKHVIGVINYQQEGTSLLHNVAQDIACGRRRVNGHLSAQALGMQLASAEVVTGTYWRINRVAVLPEFRRQGIASSLTYQLLKRASDAGIDALTTSYGATPELVKFWQHNDFLPVKPGLKQDASSGEFSLLMYKPLTEKYQCLANVIARRYTQELSLHPTPAVFGNSNLLPVDDDADADRVVYECGMNILQQVISTSRSLQHARGSIGWFIKTQCDEHEDSNTHYRVIKDYILHINKIADFIAQYKLTGKREAEQFVATHIAGLLSSKSL